MKHFFTLLLLLGLFTPAWADAQKGQPIKTTGTIKHQGLEGGFWGIVGDDGQNYDPQNLAPEFQKEGLRVSFEAETKPDAASFHMWGTIVEIKSIKKLGSAANPTDTLKPVIGTVKADISKTWEAFKRVLSSRGDTLPESKEGVVYLSTKPHALDQATLLASIKTQFKPEDSGYTNGTYSLTFKFEEIGKNKTKVTLNTTIMAFGRAHKAMLKPDTWDPVLSNGKIEKEVLKAIQEEAKKRK
jgi:hypothetical protein